MAKNPIDKLIDDLTSVSDSDFSAKFVIDYFKSMTVIAIVFWLFRHTLFMVDKV